MLALVLSISLSTAAFASNVGVLKPKVAEAQTGPTLTLTPGGEVNIWPGQDFQFAALFDTNGNQPGGVFDVSYDSGAVWSYASLTGVSISNGILDTYEGTQPGAGEVVVTFQGQQASASVLIGNLNGLGYKCLAGSNYGLNHTNNPGGSGSGSWEWDFVPDIPNFEGGGAAQWFIGQDLEGYITTTYHPSSIPNTNLTNRWDYSVSPNATFGVKLLSVTVEVWNAESGNGIYQCNDIGVNILAPEYVPQASFSCSVTTNNATLDPGGTTSFNVQTQSSGGFNSSVSYSAAITPSPANAPTVTPASFTQNSPYPSTATTVSTSPNTPQGTYTVTYTGTSGGTTKTCSAQLVVNGAGGNFNIIITPAPAPPANGIGSNTNPNRINIGSNARFQVFIECTGGFNGPVTEMLAQTTLNGVDLSLGATSLPCGGTTILTVSNSSSVPENQQSTITNVSSESIMVRGSGQL